MTDYCYLDVELKLRDENKAVLTSAYFLGSIEDSLLSFFGELGGDTDLELIKFDRNQKRAILRVQQEFLERTRTAITLIGRFQDIPCHFLYAASASAFISQVKMSYCKVFGKDRVHFVTKEDHATPSTIELPPPEPSQGLITSDGEINWGCPCLGGMTTGPCGVEFRDAFSCFHYSKADPKGSDCFEAFQSMHTCFKQYPTIYDKATGDDDNDDDTNLNLAKLEEEAATVPKMDNVGEDTTLAKTDD